MPALVEMRGGRASLGRACLGMKLFVSTVFSHEVFHRPRLAAINPRARKGEVRPLPIIANFEFDQVPSFFTLTSVHAKINGVQSPLLYE
ncbi:MAG: hypothetical protein O7A08_02075 [SAR324 cluster bacterium]|nr:hypothetical protein [SAR324 cluster bacterium]